MSPVSIHVSTLLYAVAYNGFETLSHNLNLTTHLSTCRQLTFAIKRNRNLEKFGAYDDTDEMIPVESWVWFQIEHQVETVRCPKEMVTVDY